MRRRDLSEASAAYLDDVEQLLSDVDEDERTSLLADLADQLGEMSEVEVIERLGTPQTFVAEYRRSAGIEEHDATGARSIGETIVVLVSGLALPFGVLLLFSFGGQIVFGPFALAIEWILARISPRPLRLAWCLLAGALGGEVTYLVLDIHVRALDGFLAVVMGLVTAGLVALIFYRTTDDRREGRDQRL